MAGGVAAVAAGRDYSVVSSVSVSVMVRVRVRVRVRVKVSDWPAALRMWLREGTTAL